MTALPRTVRALLAVGSLVAVLACSGARDEEAAARRADAQRAADCDAVVATLLVTAQRYLDSIEATSPDAGEDTVDDATPAPADPAEAEEQFTRALVDLRGYAAEVGCDPAEFRSGLTAGLERLRAGGPVARAVLLQLQADAGPRTRTGRLPAGGDVAAAVAAAAPDAVVELEAGVYELTDTLVLLRGVTLRGAGRDATVLRGAATGGVVLVLTGDPVRLENLTLAHVGDLPASVVSAAPAATLSVTGARVTGASSDADGAGGIGLLMAAGSSGQTGPRRRTSLTTSDSEIVDNAVAGMVVSGEHRVDVTRAVLSRNGQCGICFLGTSDGVVRDSVLEQNAAGVVAAGEARPLLTDVTVRGGEVGLQAMDRAGPQVERARISGSARGAFLFTDAATGAVRDSTCHDVAFGLVVGPSAAPAVEDNDCDVARSQ